MENTNSIRPQGGARAEIDWKIQFPLAERQKVVLKIMERLRTTNVQEEAKILDKVSKLEEKVFLTAKSKEAYFRTIVCQLQKSSKKPPTPQLLTSSSPPVAYSVESSTQQAANLSPHYQAQGIHMTIPAAGKSSLPQQRPVNNHYQETPKLNQPQTLLQQSSSSGHQQNTVPDLLTQHRLYNSQVNNDQKPSNICTNYDQCNTSKVVENVAEVQQPQMLVQTPLHKQPANRQHSALAQMQHGTPQHLSQKMNEQSLEPQNSLLSGLPASAAESTSQERNPTGDDWKDALFQRITKMKELFLPVLKAEWEEVARELRKFDSTSQLQRADVYETWKKKENHLRKLYTFLQFTRDRMAEDVRRWLPMAEKIIFSFCRNRNQGSITSLKQEQNCASDEQTTRQTLQLQPQNKQQSIDTAEFQNRQLQGGQVNEKLGQTKEQTELQLRQQSLNLQLHHRPPSNLLIDRQVVPEKPTSLVQSPIKANACTGVSPLANTGDIEEQATDRPFVICIGGISPSGLLADCEGIGENHNHIVSTEGNVPEEKSSPEKPIDRLLKAVGSMSYDALSASVNDMESVLSLMDRTAGQLTGGNGYKFAVGEDLAEAQTSFWEQMLDEISVRTKRKFCASSVPSSIFESGTIYDGLNHLNHPETSDLEYSIATHGKKSKFEIESSLLEEIREINQQLIETVVEICRDDVESGTIVSVSESEGTTVRCCFNPAISPNMNSENASFLLSPIMPLKLLIPINYPEHSPVILDKLPTEVSMDNEDLSVKAKSKLAVALRLLRQPMSLRDIVRTWDSCAHEVISQSAMKLGGGSFSSTYGTWQNCNIGCKVLLQ